MRIGRDYGNPGDYDTRFAGLNARMSEFHAAMALESLARFDESLERRRFLASLYRGYLDDVPGIEFQAFSARDTSTFKDLTIRVDADAFGLSRDGLALALLAEGVDTRKYFDPPVHRQRAYGHLEYRRLPVTDAVASSVLSLPVYPDLSDEHVERVCDDHPRRARARGRARRVRVDDGRGRRAHLRARLNRQRSRRSTELAERERVQHRGERQAVEHLRVLHEPRGGRRR